MMILYRRCANTLLSKKLLLGIDAICCERNIFEERLNTFFLCGEYFG